MTNLHQAGKTIHNQRNGLETQAKALMTSVIRLIRFTLEPCNFNLNIFQDFVLTYLKKDDCFYKTIDFLNFPGSKKEMYLK